VKIARPLLDTIEAQAAEIERLREALDALDAKIKERRAIYVKKRQRAKAILIETDTPSDRYQFAVEVLDILLTEVCPEAHAALGEKQ
jgi:hypothetical protein